MHVLWKIQNTAGSWSSWNIWCIMYWASVNIVHCSAAAEDLLIAKTKCNPGRVESVPCHLCHPFCSRLWLQRAACPSKKKQMEVWRAPGRSDKQPQSCYSERPADVSGWSELHGHFLEQSAGSPAEHTCLLWEAATKRLLRVIRCALKACPFFRGVGWLRSHFPELSVSVVGWAGEAGFVIALTQPSTRGIWTACLLSGLLLP